MAELLKGLRIQVRKGGQYIIDPPEPEPEKKTEAALPEVAAGEFDSNADFKRGKGK